MATTRWKGDAPNVAEVWHVTPANVAVGDKFELTVNGKTISVEATAATVANVTGLLTTAWNATTAPQEMQEATAADSTTHVTITMDTAGKPITITGTASGSATIDVFQVTKAKGKNFWDDPQNWSGGTVPGASDTAVIDSGNVDIKYGLNQNSGGSSTNAVQTITISGTPTGGTFTLTFDGHTTAPIAYNASTATVDTEFENLPNIASGDITVGGGPLPGSAITVTFGGTWAGRPVPRIVADASSLTGGTSPAITVAMTTPGVTDVTLTELKVTQNYSGEIGLPEINADATTKYFEYRTQYLQIGATTVTIGEGEGIGSARIKIDNQDVQATVNVYNTGQPAEQGRNTMLWLGTHASNVVNIIKGSLGIAARDGETATVATLRVGYLQNPFSDVTLKCGSGVTLTDIDMGGGTVEIDSATTTIDQLNGDLTIYSAAHAAINIDGGNCYYQSTGTITTVKVGSDALLSFARDLRPRTVTNCEVNKDASLLDPFATVTFTNGVDLNRCNIDDLRSIDLGTHKTLSVSAI